MKLQRIVFLLLSAAVLWCIAAPEAGTAASAPSEIAESCRDIALTFDDGPRADTTGKLLDGLKARGVHATFFLIGNQIDANAALVQRMKAEGHQVGNHTWDHTKLQGTSTYVLAQEVAKTNAKLCSLLGSGDYWVRPPYGLLDQRQKTLFSVPLVKWSVDPEDWRLKNADRDVRAVLAKAQPGDIILMHDSVPASVDAALRIVDALQAKGYVFVTVRELLSDSGLTPQAGVMYYSAQRCS